MFKHPYRYIFILVLSLFAFANTILCDVYHYFNIEIEWYYALLTIFSITLLVWEGNRLIEPLLEKKLSSASHKIRFLAGFFIAGNIISMLASVLVVYLVGNVLHGYTWQQNFNPLKLNLIYVYLINLLFHLINTIFFYFIEYKRHWQEAEELRRISSQASLQLIKSQVNPHFLFNNLNVLSGMLIKDNPEANQFIEEFSKVYRYILNNEQNELVELHSELEFIQPYIFLLQKRFHEGLVIDIQIEPHYKNYLVIPVALQMLIENAIKHNIVSRSRPLHISIHANGNNTLVVKNNLQLRKAEESSTQIGLNNIIKRYHLISGKSVIINKTATEFEVTLPLLHLN